MKYFLLAAACLWGGLAMAAQRHGLAMHGELKYPPDFAAFEYVNPAAPKGGSLRQAMFHSFDTFNPFVINGMTPDGIGLLHDTLMKQSGDEPFSLYGLIARAAELDADRRWVRFHLDARARFSDGSPITAADVLFSFEVLRDKGLPSYRAYYQEVERAVVESPHKIVFHFNPAGRNRELPLILAQLPILSKQYWEGRDFARTTLDIPVSSGPYRIQSFDAGRSITYARAADYWAADVNVNRGFYNFDILRYDVYRDTTVAVEAFKAGHFDVRQENEAKKWVSFLESDLARSGKIKTRAFAHRLPAGMQGFVFNLRRPIFRDARVREALAYAFDFDWTNANLFWGQYRRTESYFENSFLKAPPLPSPQELRLLAPHRDLLPQELWTQAYLPPQNAGNLRWNLGKALELLAQAGWTVRGGALRNAAEEPFVFEILLDSASGGVWERVVLPFAGHLKRLGIQARIRTVDMIQYKNRLDNFDYDMIVGVWGQSLSPGTEQRYFWGSAAADTPGSWNLSGVKSPVIDALIENLIAADSLAELTAAAHALDRVLLWSYLVIPHWHAPAHRYVYWDKFGMPQTLPLTGTSLMTWWSAEAAGREASTL